ncbi:hypothetical protein K0A96_00080 [Patescibacteria group bacterium]|nr:hypothetical protein [Patescibacteria group bacterium]
MPEKQQEEENEVEALKEVGDIENHPNYRFIPKGYHEWKQEGYYLICRSCELEHAVWLGKDHLLTGIKEDGKPIIKKRSELFKRNSQSI